MEDMESSAKKAELESDQMKQLLGLLQKEAPENNTVAVFLDSKAKQEVARKMNVSEISDVFSKIRKSSLKSELSPLHVAAYIGNESVCQVLLDQRDVKVHVVDEFGQTPLHFAAAHGKVDAVKRLRFSHADVYFRTRNGASCIELAEGEDVKESLIGPRFGGDEVEDEYLQEKLPSLIDRIVQSGKSEDYEMMLEWCYCLRGEIRSATSSLTSVPKPLKILVGSYQDLKSLYEELESQHPDLVSSLAVSTLATIVSVLSMSKKDGDKERDCIRFCIAFLKAQLEQGSPQSLLDPLQSFGDPYVRHLCMQFPEEYQQLDPTDASCVHHHTILTHLQHELMVYLLKRNAEPEVVDLLMEIEEVRDIKEDLRKLEDGDQSMSQIIHRHLRTVVGDRKAQVVVNNRVCQYLISCVKYVQEPMNSRLLETAFDLHMTYQSYPQAILVAMQLNDMDLVRRVFLSCPDRVVRKQLAFMLGRQQVFLDLDEEADLEDSEELKEIISNVLLNNNFLTLARELDIVEPKEPEHIYKTHLENARFSSANSVDSAKQNLASSFVNGFVNCAFGKDNIMTEDGNKWIYKHKPTGMLSATASLGLILLWDVDAGLTEIDKFLYANDDNIKAGALLACGVVNSGVRNECDPALALLSDYVQNKSSVIRSGAILGLGLSYAGSNREEVLDVLIPSLTEADSTPEVSHAPCHNHCQ
jgi:26S proteasome regulatory subunit N1